MPDSTTLSGITPDQELVYRSYGFIGATTLYTVRTLALYLVLDQLFSIYRIRYNLHVSDYRTIGLSYVSDYSIILFGSHISDCRTLIPSSVVCLYVI